MHTKIEKLVYGGDGLAHGNGRTLFVPFVLPGEEVEVTAIEQSKKYTRCRLDRVLSRSAERIEPLCPHFRACGGCQYQHMSYEVQLRLKEEILRETLRRLGHLDWSNPITLHPSPPFGYRNRAQWKIRPLQVQSRDRSSLPANVHSLGIGYFRASSTILCPIESCAILSPSLSKVLEEFQKQIAKRTMSEGVREIEAFADAEDQKLLLNITLSSLRKANKTFVEELLREIPGIESVLRQETSGQRMELNGPGFLHYKVSEKLLRVGHMSFFQINRFVVEDLVRTVAMLAGKGDMAFDLYAGVGLFSIFLAENFAAVKAVEADPAAARDLEINAATTQRNISSHNCAADYFLSNWKRRPGSNVPDVAVVDPPRSGLEPNVIQPLLDISALRILYVSCDPSTLARDLAQLCARMYKITGIHLFDMFPQTSHIETLVCLERTS